MSVERPTINTPIAFQDPLPDRVDVVIIGGGVIGIFSALYMARRGMKALVCEKGRVAGEQSSRNWGWIRQQGRDHAELPIMTRALNLWHEVNRETNGACGIRTCGTTYLAETDGSGKKDWGFLELAEDAGLDTRLLSKTEIAALFGDASDARWSSAMHTASDACGEPWQAVPAVAHLAQREGVLIREACAARALDIEAGSIKGVVTQDGTVGCDQVVLAAGAWSSLFARKHGVQIPQLAVRSTVARTAEMPEFLSGCTSDEEIALRRRQDGAYSVAANGTLSVYAGPDAFRHFRKYIPHLSAAWNEVRPHPAAPIGYPDAWYTPRDWAADEVSPFERQPVLEPKPKESELAKIKRRFAARFPKLGPLKLSSAWAGMIDAMPDVVPIVDRVPTLDGLIMATGMSGHGFGIGPGFGEIIARMANGEDPGFDMTRFRFGRFTDGSKLGLGPLL